MQRIIKRDGREVEFDKSKIIEAISCANQEIIKSKQIGPRKINQLANIVEEKCSEYKRAIKVEDINDLIEDELKIIQAIKDDKDLSLEFVKTGKEEFAGNLEYIDTQMLKIITIWMFPSFTLQSALPAPDLSLREFVPRTTAAHTAF